MERARARIQIPLKLNLHFILNLTLYHFNLYFFAVFLNILYVEKMETKIVFSAMKKIKLLQAH